MLRKLREVQNYEDHFRDEDHVRIALAAYYGMVSFLDDNIGRVLKALHETGLDDDTLVVYTSDHGDNLGTRTFWGKSNMYEEAVGVPLILKGPGIPAGHRVDDAGVARRRLSDHHRRGRRGRDAPRSASSRARRCSSSSMARTPIAPSSASTTPSAR